jgi:hypothetical protein
MILVVAAALAGDDAEALLAASRRSEREQRWADAVAACETLVATYPDVPEARTCAGHLAAWRARQDPDGTYTSLATLEAVRRRQRPEDALEPWVSDEGVPRVLRAEAASLRARRALDRGDTAAATAAVAPWLEVDVGDPQVSAVARSVDTEARALDGPTPEAGTAAAHRWWRAVRTATDRVALAGGAGSLLILGPPAARGFRRSTRPWGLLILAGAALGAWVVAEGWEEGGGRAVPPMFAGLALVHVLAVWALGPPKGAAVAVALRGAALVGTLATVWLALSWFDGLQALGVPL